MPAAFLCLYGDAVSEFLGFYPNVTLNLFQGLLTDEWLAVCVLKPVFMLRRYGFSWLAGLQAQRLEAVMTFSLFFF